MRQTITVSPSDAFEPGRELVEAQLEQVLDGVADGVILSSGKHATLNAAAKRILALPEGIEFRSHMLNPRSLEGAPFEIPTDQAPGLEALRTGGGGVRFRIRATAFDGRDLVIDGSAAPVPSGAVVVFRDVTDEYERNRLNEETLNALFDSLPVALTVTHPQTYELLTVNAAFCELVGRPAEAIVGCSPPFPWWDENEKNTEFAVAPGSTVERIYRDPDGRPHPVVVSVHDIPGDDGKPALLLALIEDLSAERRMQQQLVQSGKLAAIGELAAGVAHEINNPLFAILGLTEFLLKESEPESKARQRLELIQQTGLEIKEIVRALLDFARENAEDKHIVSIQEVVRATADLVRRTNAHKGVELIDSYDGSDAFVNASPNQLKQIFLNLMANARQAMPNGGTVNIDVRSENGMAVVSVSDDGPGIDPQIAPRIFEPFFTTKRQSGGTGLGLSVSLGIAEAHGGTLTHVSEPAAGSTFTLRLPLEKEAE